MTHEQIMVKKVIDRAQMVWGQHAVNPGKDFCAEDIAASIVKHCADNKIALDLACAQAYVEGHFGYAPTATRSRRTRNLYNVGNVDSGADKSFPTWDAGIKAYCELMRREYNWNEGEYISVESMETHDFTRPKGGRYATAGDYTNQVVKIAMMIRHKLGFAQLRVES